MSDTLPNPPLPPLIAGSDFYVTGGTLRPDAPCYVERQADKELWEGLLQGEFCYVLTSRQMGKSSLMVRTVRRLRQDGVAVAVLDLTSIGQNLTVEQWYDGLVSRLGQQLELEEELLAFWNEHPEWGPLQRWTTAIEQVVLRRISGKVVIFVDEIDIVRSLPFSTDEFFAAIRQCYNRRASEPVFARLAFGLLGVAAPGDLIRDTRMTPFNIGRRIELNDFAPWEAAPLARGLGLDEPSARELLTRVLYWTGGHPYLTQRLCRALAESLLESPPVLPSVQPIPPVLPTRHTVDHLAGQLFLSRQARDRDDNLIFVRERILRSEGDLAGLLYLYRKVHNGQAVPDDETNELVTVLRLAGVVRRVNGYLEVRNRIYKRVFDQNWIQTNMPEAELRRQRHAVRRGMVLGFGIAAILLLAYLVVGPMFNTYRRAKLAGEIAQRMELGYRQVISYRDTFQTTLEVGMGGTSVPVDCSGSLSFQRPDRVNLAMVSGLHSPEAELRLISDGERACVYSPASNQYQVLSALPEPSPIDLPLPLARQMGPLRVLPLYRLLLCSASTNSFLSHVRNLQYIGSAELNGQAVNLIRWDHDAAALLGAMGLTNSRPGTTLVPVTAWVDSSNFLVLQMRLELSPWAEDLMGKSAAMPLTGLSLVELHKGIAASTLASSSNRFDFEPGADVRLVSRLELPSPDYASLAAPKRQFSRFIPARLPVAPTNLVDLTDYYNAALVQNWHPGSNGNNLDILPPGLLQLGGVAFDVRGVVQLAGQRLRAAGGRFPQQLIGIRIGQSCRQLHFLHAAGWSAPEGTRIGSYIVHYADGQEETIPIIYGEDVRDWNAAADSSTRLKRSTIVWSGVNKAQLPVRLFLSTWVNPKPDIPVLALDYLSTMSGSAPFLLALTAEPR